MRALNPVLSRELVERMRGPRAMLVLSFYLGLLSLIVVLVYQSRTDVTADPFGPPVITQIAEIGQGLFEWSLFFMLLLVLFLVPGFTAGAIAGERERQTLLPLQVTLLRPSSILLGKVAASVVFTLLLVLATLPLLTVGYLVGGVTIGDILKGTGFVLFVAVAVACISVACSTFAKRVQTATVLAYGLVLLLAGGTIAGFLVARQIDESSGGDTVDPPTYIVAGNPIAGLADLIGEDPYASNASPFGGSSGSTDSPLTGMRDLLNPDVFSDAFFGREVGFEVVAAAEPAPIAVDGGGFAEGGGFVQFDNFGQPIPSEATDDGWLPLWGDTMAILGGLGLVSLVAASRRLRTPAKTER